MTTTTAARELRASDPIVFADLVQLAGRAAKRSATRDKHWASAHGITRNRATEHRNGDPNSPAVHVLAEFRRLASHELTDAIPLLLESWGIVMATQVRKLSNDELYRLHEELTDREHDLEAAESKLTARLDDHAPPAEYDAAAEADMLEAELQVKRAQVRREIAKRKRAGRWFS